MELSITLIIVIATAITSIAGFSNQKVINDLIFYPPAVTNRRQWYRFFSSGVIHADWLHLIFNMVALYSFGELVENGYPYVDGTDYGFLQIFGVQRGKLFYLLMYVSALFVSLLPTYLKHRNDYHYRSLGASGAVSAVVFAALLLEPRSGVSMFFLPIAIPGYIFGPLYLIVSHMLARRSADNINHSAHIWGALYGIVFVLSLSALCSDYDIPRSFVEKVQMHLGKFF